MASVSENVTVVDIAPISEERAKSMARLKQMMDT